MSDDEPPWLDDVPSAVHSALSLLRGIVNGQAGDPSALESWQAVYGAAVIQLDRSKIAAALEERAPASPADAFDLLAVLLAEQFSGVLHLTAAAHVQVEMRLVESLAEATGQPVDSVLDDLDAWAARELD
jgi:hypothetical protein